MLLHFKIVPKELAITPFPTPLITPPVTKIYFITTALLVLYAPLCTVDALILSFLTKRAIGAGSGHFESID
jgi:hypothetical protein